MPVDFNTAATPRPPVTFEMNPGAALAGIAPVFMRKLGPQVAIATTVLGVIGLVFNGMSKKKPEAHQPAAPNFTQIMPMESDGASHIAPEAPPAQPAVAHPEASTEPESPAIKTPLADTLDHAAGLTRDSQDHTAVKAMQEFLQKAGYGDKLGKSGPHHDGVDGVFKEKTKNALEKFQEDHHLPKTGVLDKDTLKAMHEVEKSWSVEPSKPNPSILSPQQPETDPAAPKSLDEYIKSHPIMHSPLMAGERPSIELPKLDAGSGDNGGQKPAFRQKPGGLSF